MLKRFCRSTMVLANKTRIIHLLTAFFVSINAYADPPIDDLTRTFLQFNNGTWIQLTKGNWDKNYDRVELVYGRNRFDKKIKEIIWSKTFETNEQRAWNYAYFLRIKRGRFIFDLDGDGSKEFAVATYDLGNNMLRPILIFSIYEDHIAFVREHGPYNIAADEPVFK